MLSVLSVLKVHFDTLTMPFAVGRIAEWSRPEPSSLGQTPKTPWANRRLPLRARHSPSRLSPSHYFFVDWLRICLLAIAVEPPPQHAGTVELEFGSGLGYDQEYRGCHGSSTRLTTTHWATQASHDGGIRIARCRDFAICHHRTLTRTPSRYSR